MLADLDLGCDFDAIIHLGFCLFKFFWWVFGSVEFCLSFEHGAGLFCLGASIE